MNNSIQQQLSNAAWRAREHAQARKTKVGAALLSTTEVIYAGCNIEHDFCKSFHAEEVAIIKMISNGITTFSHLLVVANMEKFTPCGNCLDWLMYYCEDREKTIIGFQNHPTSEVIWYSLKELMPHYPIKLTTLPL